MAEPKTYLHPQPTKGYAKNLELEAALQAKPDDASAYLVYGDWLTQQGDPRGELVVLQHKLAMAQDDGLSKRETEILHQNDNFFGGIAVRAAPRHLGSVGDGIADVGWKWGFFETARLFNTIDWMDGKFPSREVCQRFFNLPAAAALKELTVGVLRWEYQAQDVPALIEEASKASFAKQLEVFRLGDVEGIDVDCSHHTLGDLSGVSSAFPNLIEFTLYGSDFTLGTKMELSRLKKLVVKTCGLTKESFGAILDGTLPDLEHLEIWFGASDYGCDVTMPDLAPLFEENRFPKLKYLGLKNSEFADQICQRIAAAKVLPRLTSLALSAGTMSDDGARFLLDDRAQLAHLKELDVSESFLTEEVIGELEAIGPTILSDDQKEIEDDYRYVSLAE